MKTTSAELSPEDTFPTSLHAQGPSNGRENVYEAGPGLLTRLPFRHSPCQNCHAETYADGTPVDDATYVPGCKGCHAKRGDQVTYTGNPDDPVPGYLSEDPESWTYVGNVPDVAQSFKDYVEPLTSEQMLELMKDYSEYESTGQGTFISR